MVELVVTVRRFKFTNGMYNLKLRLADTVTGLPGLLPVGQLGVTTRFPPVTMKAFVFTMFWRDVVVAGIGAVEPCTMA
jgi:hypothetical protein